MREFDKEAFEKDFVPPEIPSKEKMEGLWCDFCGKKHAGRCPKVRNTN